MIRSVKALSALLFTAGAFLFSACGSPLEVVEALPEPLTEADFEVKTIEPELNEFRATFRGRFTVVESKVDQELVWGFMSRKDDEPLSAMKPINVGRGYQGTSFFIHRGDLPRGEQLMVCAFVEFTTSAEAEPMQLLGDEVFFNF